MTKKILECSISSPGSAFILGGRVKNTVFPPGTIGFKSFIQGPDYEIPNIVFQQVVTIKRGKTGKNRLNTNILLCPIFPLFPENKKEVFMLEEERKYFVDLKLKDTNQFSNIFDPKQISSTEFMGWLLAKALFIKELDKANYPPDHKIMQDIGLNGGKQMNIWGTSKSSLLSLFVRKAERCYDEDMDYLEHEFCTPHKRSMLLHELAQKEACLAIPQLEYNKRVIGVINSALAYIKPIVKDNKKYLTYTDRTLCHYKEKELMCDSFINKRINKILKNRELL